MDFVTVPMPAEMRTRAHLLAAELQRKRADKSVRFTPNSVFRVAIAAFLERFQLASEDLVNSEEDLRRLFDLRLEAGKSPKRRSI
jgi:hypothetical protein